MEHVVHVARTSCGMDLLWGKEDVEHTCLQILYLQLLLQKA